MSFQLFLTQDAARDLKEICGYIAKHDHPDKAKQVLNEIRDRFHSLRDSPERGAIPKELLALGIREFREIFFKPYRILYQVIGESVFILLITDGRRDMSTVLQQRLLKPESWF